MPSGMIVLWSGAADAIPGGWVLCDGQNGTPDLRGRFVLGAGGGYAVGAKGGEETHRLTVGEMPSHSHAIWRHVIGASSSQMRDSTDNYEHVANELKSGIVGNAGGGENHNNMPPYYALCYIMKT